MLQRILTIVIACLPIIIIYPTTCESMTPYESAGGTAYLGTGGYNLDTKSAFTMIGFGTQVIPDGYVIFHGGAARDGGEVELACTYLLRHSSGFFIGPILAPGTDLILIDQSDGDKLKAYLTAGIGAIFGGTWRINTDQWGIDKSAGFGFHVGIEWNSDFDDNNFLESGLIIFGGIQLVL